MQKISELTCLTVLLVLVAACCLAGNVVSENKVNDRLDAAVPYCYNTTIHYGGCDYENRAGTVNVNCDYHGNFTYTDCCTDCKPDNAADASVRRRRYLQHYVSACSK